jgi:hypothetical protein
MASKGAAITSMLPERMMSGHRSTGLSHAFLFISG